MVLDILLRAEDQIASFSSGTPPLIPAEIMGSTIRDLSVRAQNAPPAASLEDLILAAAQDPLSRREVAIFLVRCAAVPGLVGAASSPTNSTLHRAIADAVAGGAPDLFKASGAEEKKFFQDRYHAIAVLHDRLTAPLQELRALPTVPKELAGRRQEVLRVLNNQNMKAYLAPYGFSRGVNAMREILNNICELLETKDSTFGQKLQAAQSAAAESRERYCSSTDFLGCGVFLPALDVGIEALQIVHRESSERFECQLRPRRPTGASLERKYPLHEINRLVRIKLPLVNDGPGQALDVRIQIVCTDKNLLVSEDNVDVGSVIPGDFSLSFDMMIGAPVQRAPILVDLSWRTAGGPERLSTSFLATIVGQDPSTNWDALAVADPYSTEVAQGDEFVGRRKKVLALAGRIQRMKMQSSYITGQKRVGKTSLALAVVASVVDLGDRDLSAIYLEYGEYARSDAEATVEALGLIISERLQRHLPKEVRLPGLDFRGTLAPLNQIASLLQDELPSKRFSIILDEFDEIHPEIYRYGPLAEAFFSNLRTLSAKRNISVILVGGENMPFIIGAQGDQLNKFMREPLDYFSRSEEWDDFSSLVRQRELPLSWHESAVTHVFNLTNGHPYYAKLLCGRILSNAIEDHDTEVTVDEVERAAAGLIQTLDTNAFSHFWKDGIPAGREEASVIELKRSRILVAIGRSLRHGGKVTVETIAEQRAGLQLSTSDIAPLLSDFCRREIFRERGREYEFVLPLFGSWLDAKGVAALVADTLGDEMAEALQLAEDKAYVGGPEITKLVESWQLYRGRPITAEDVRQWLAQVTKATEQRLLFKILQRVRFVSEAETREKLRTAFSLVKKHTTSFTPESRSQRRYDIAVTYVDGPAKSGSRYADLFTEENLLSSSCVMAPANFSQGIEEYEKAKSVVIDGLVIVDDISVTGDGLSKNVKEFVAKNHQFLSERTITVIVVTLFSTRQADEKIRRSLRQLQGIEIDYRTCEILRDQHFAFAEAASLWVDSEEERNAKDLVLRIGRQVEPRAPFGYGELGMLLTFSNTCPNNTLPLLHASSSGWKALFPRPVN